MRALLSVYDKTGLLDLAEGLTKLGWELVSSGGTSAALAEAGIAHIQVDAVTGFPEMMDGRLKTLHPKVHGGILADRTKPAHLDAAKEHGIGLIELVVCNLYPFTSKPSVELIDIGGPTMVRSAAKNHASVGVLVDPNDYAPVLAELQTGGQLSEATRVRLAGKAFAHTATYDAAIANWFADGRAATPTTAPSPTAPSPTAPSPTVAEDGLPVTLHLALEHAQSLRYGENPHQRGARYRFAGGHSWWDDAIQHGGKELSYLNVYDADAAWRIVHELGDDPAVVVIKHANPCGAAIANDITTAYHLAHQCDPVSAFGGIVAVNRRVPRELAVALSQVFTEVLVAPGYDADALDVLTAKKNLRLLSAGPPSEDKVIRMCTWW